MAAVVRAAMPKTIRTARRSAWSAGSVGHNAPVGSVRIGRPASFSEGSTTIAEEAEEEPEEIVGEDDPI